MSLKRGVFYTFLTQIPSVLLGIIAGIFINRILGPEGKGMHALLQTDIILFALFLGLNINFGLIYFISRESMPKRKLLGIAATIFLLGNVLFGLTLLLLRFFLHPDHLLMPTGQSGDFIYIFLFAGFFMTLLNSTISGVFQGLRDFRVVNQVTLLNSVMNAAVFGGLFLYLDQVPSKGHLYPILYASLGILALNTLFWVITYIRKVKLIPSFKLKRSLISRILQVTLVGYLANLMNLLNYRLDIWILESYKGPLQVGLYALAVNFAQMFWSVSEPIATVLTPYLNNPKEPNKWRKFTFFSRLNFTLVAGAGLVAFLFASILIPVVYGEDFAESVLPFQILLPGILLSCGSKIFAVVAISEDKIKYNLYATAVGLVVTVVLDFWLIPPYGLYGAAIATSIAYSCVFLTVWLLVMVKLKKPFRNYFFLQWEDVKTFKEQLKGRVGGGG